MDRDSCPGKILIVDDDRLVSSVLRQSLEREGYDCRVASTMNQALAEFTVYRSDIVLTDLLIPGGTAIDLLREIERVDPLVPVIIITADNSVDWAAEAVRTRVYDYLTKPVGRNELHSVVTKALSERRRTQTRRRQQLQLQKDHRELEVQLERRTSILSLVFDRIAEGIVIWDSSQRVVDVSESFLELAGISAATARTIDVDGLFERHPSEGSIQHQMSQLLREDATRDEWVGDVGIRVPGGVAIKARLRLYTCEVPHLAGRAGTANSGPLAAASSAHATGDTTGYAIGKSPARTRYAVGLIHYDESQEQLSRQLQRADRLASTAVLAGSAAHEIKNDLGPLLGYLSMLEPMDRDGMVPSMRTSVQRIREQIDQILAPLRHRNRLLGPIGLGSSVSMTIDDLRRAGALRRISLNIEQPTREVLVRADRAELHQIVMNLVTNAVDSLGDGGGRHRGSVTLTISEDHGFGVLEVRDDGSGITEDLRARIFEPFFTTKGRHGTGLGLPVVQDIVRGSRGNVTIESEPGIGTAVRIRLPLHEISSERKASGVGVRQRRSATDNDEPEIGR